MLYQDIPTRQIRTEAPPPLLLTKEQSDDDLVRRRLRKGPGNQSDGGSCHRPTGERGTDRGQTQSRFPRQVRSRSSSVRNLEAQATSVHDDAHRTPPRGGPLRLLAPDPYDHVSQGVATLWL